MNGELAERVVANLIQSAVLLPVQILGDGKPVTPERRLLAEVVDDAFGLLKYGPLSEFPKAKAKADEALAWIDSERRDWVFAFQYICDALELDAGSLRSEARAIYSGKRRYSRSNRTALRVWKVTG